MSVIDNIRFTFLYIEFYSMGKTWVYPESVIPYSIFRYIEKGKAELCIDGEETIVEENQIVYIPQGCKMSCRALSEAFVLLLRYFMKGKICWQNIMGFQGFQSTREKIFILRKYTNG